MEVGSLKSVVFKFSILLYTGNLPVLVPSIDHQLKILDWDSRRLNFGYTLRLTGLTARIRRKFGLLVKSPRGLSS